MTLPPGVIEYPDFGHRVPVTQRGWWAEYDDVSPLHKYADGDRHYTSCMLAAAAMILERIGYQTPLLRGQDAYAGANPAVTNLVLALHLATGRYPRGTTVQDTKNAINKLFAGEDVPILYGTMSADEIRMTLGNRGIIRFSVRPLTDMPRAWDLPAGYKGNGHAYVANRRERICDGTDATSWPAGYHLTHAGVRELHIVDPMLRPATGYDGQWVPKDKFLSFADADPNDSEYIVTWGFKSAVLDGV